MDAIFATINEYLDKLFGLISKIMTAIENLTK